MNNNNLKQFFPVIKTREQILTEILSNSALSEEFAKWPTYHQEEFLDMCTGTKGIKMLYAPYFKEIFNAEAEMQLADTEKQLADAEMQLSNSQSELDARAEHAALLAEQARLLKLAEENGIQT